MVFDPSMKPMLEVFIYETTTILEQLDDIMIRAEKEKSFTGDEINEIFRFMHTVKGSSAMMGVNSISTLAHKVEDVFYIIREDPNKLQLISEAIFDLVFQASDFFKAEIEKIQESDDFEEGDPQDLIKLLVEQAGILNNSSAASAPAAPAAPAAGETDEPAPASDSDAEAAGGDDDSNAVHQVIVRFEDGCQMENLRAYMLVNQLKDWCEYLETVPANPETDSNCCETIINDGFLVKFRPLERVEDVYSAIERALNVESYQVIGNAKVSADETAAASSENVEMPAAAEEETTAAPVADAPANQPAKTVASPAGTTNHAVQSLTSVSQAKLDTLMSLVGELVTTESMVVSNPDLRGLRLENFNKSTRELRKLTSELQDVVMSMRMMPLSGVFQKMNRIVRDMSRKLDRKVNLVTIGGETEMDKNVNDAISDPFIHMIRNSVDHAIESPEERQALGKPETGTITITAQNVGGEIIITIADDGRGLMKEKILEKAKKNNILTKPESEYTDREIFSLIMLPGFSTKEKVTEFSGRGVGMDVVRKNIEKIGGSISVDSVPNVGTTFTIKIPPTLVIVKGMEVSVGDTIFILPITSITQTFRLEKNQIIENTDHTEMIMIRGECLPVIRLYNLYGVEPKTTDLNEGILIQVENGDKSACLFFDELIGEQQVVVKPLPSYFNCYNVKGCGVSGCTILGDGGISLVLDANNIITYYKENGYETK